MNYDIKELKKIIKFTYQGVRKELQDNDTACMRIYDRNLGVFPITVELYGPYAKIVEYGEETLDSDAVIEAVSSMAYVQRENIIYQYRKKREGIEQHSKMADENSIEPFWAKESGLLFKINLETRIDTGLFLDHMPTRMMVREYADQLRILNLFCYTGSFSVYAAAGGAKYIESVDLSNTYLSWAEENLSENGFAGDMYPCIRADVKTFLTERSSTGEKFDMIVMDPPSFSNSHNMEGTFDIQRDYIEYITLALKHLTKKGILIFSTNLTTFHFDSGRLPNTACENITPHTIPPGFSKKRKPHVCWVIRHSPEKAKKGRSPKQKPRSAQQRRGSAQKGRSSGNKSRPSRGEGNSRNRT